MNKEETYISKEQKLCMGCSKNMHYPEVTKCDNGAYFNSIFCDECKARKNENSYEPVVLIRPKMKTNE